MESTCLHVTEKEECFMVVMINSGVGYSCRRSAIRKSWLRYVKDDDIDALSHSQKKSLKIFFVLGNCEGRQDIEEEELEYGDIVIVEVEDHYSYLAAKTLAFITWLRKRYYFRYFFHCDDDSFVRLDLLLPVFYSLPPKRVYWGYIWDNNNQKVYSQNKMTRHRVTKPIRDPQAKSYMPLTQYSLDSYPPFACGCGFGLSSDLVDYLGRNSSILADYRLLDVAFGIYLMPLADINMINDDRVRPYPPLPVFQPDTIVQHYLKPEQFRPFFENATRKEEATKSEQEREKRILDFYNSMSEMGLMKK